MMLRATFRALGWIPALLAVVFVVLVLRSNGLFDDLYANADAASSLVIPELMRQAPGGSVVTLGDYGWYEPLWLFLGTAWLPLHQTLWELLPFLTWVLVAALVFSAVRQLGGTHRSATIGAALILCGGVGMRGVLWTPNFHGLAVAHVLLIAVWVVWVARQPSRAWGMRGITIAIGLGLVTAVGCTDPLVLLYGVLPLGIAAGAVVASHGSWKIVTSAVAVALIGVLGGAVLTTIGKNAGITTTTRKLTFVAPDGLIDRIGLFPALVSNIVGKSPFGDVISARGVVALTGGLVALVATVVVVRLGTRTAVHGVFGGGEVHRNRAPMDEGEGAAEYQLAWLVGATFWSAVVVLGVVAIVLVSTPGDVAVARYLVPAWVAVCVLGPSLAERHPARWVATVAASAVCLASTTLFYLAPATRDPMMPTVQAAQDLQTFAAEHGVTHGFSSYWVAAPVTRYTNLSLMLYPVEKCPQAPETNCPFYLHTISSWYEPAPIDGPTMLVTDPTLGPPVALDPRYGKPIVSRVVGEYTALIYDHDIARDLNRR